MEKQAKADSFSMKYAVLLLSLILSFGTLVGQITYNSQYLPIKKAITVAPSDIKEDYAPKVTHLEMPQPGSAKYKLQELKKKSKKLYPRKAPTEKSWKTGSSPDPIIGNGFPVANTIYLPNGDTLINYIAGGIPNDNTVCISNEGLLITSFNSRIFTHDINKDTAIFPITSLHAFSSQFTLADKFDPKLLYDPIADRFILAFLDGRLSDENIIIVCFSSSNNPADPWHLYALSGNPLNDSTWTDYPAMAITEDELFITGNQLRDNEPWQTGFSETIVWQINKESGYQGDTTLITRLWNDIKYNGENVRNLNPIQGGSAPTGPEMHLLSNKNFTLLSDTMYLVTISGKLDDPNTAININMGHTDTWYGAPPNGQQDHSDSMATNDARVLGGFIENNEIQFVANTIDTATGFAAVYHGFVTQLDSNPIFTGTIISDDSLDFGYPNIVYLGNNNCSRQSILGFNHTSVARNPGFSSLLYNSDNTYSNLVSVKEAESHVNRLNGYGYERWGDYFGIQRKYNEQGKTWMAGFYGRSNSNFIWVSELLTQDEIPLSISITDSSDVTGYGMTDGSISIEAQNGFPPYSYSWSGQIDDTLSTTSNLEPGSYEVKVTDQSNCQLTAITTIKEPNPKSNIFPNPSSGELTTFFEMDITELIEIDLYNINGQLVKNLYRDQAKQGANIFSFSLDALSNGTYILKINGKEKNILTKKVIVN